MIVQQIIFEKCTFKSRFVDVCGKTRMKLYIFFVAFLWNEINGWSLFIHRFFYKVITPWLPLSAVVSAGRRSIFGHLFTLTLATGTRGPVSLSGRLSLSLICQLWVTTLVSNLVKISFVKVIRRHFRLDYPRAMAIKARGNVWYRQKLEDPEGGAVRDRF